MALTIDILNKSMQRISMSDRRQDAAIRVGEVDSLSNNNAAVDDAIRQVIDGAGQFHQNDSRLPLADVQAVKWDKTQASIIAHYGYSESSVPRLPAEDTITESTGHIGIQWWQRDHDDDGSPTFNEETGLPNGNINYIVQMQGPTNPSITRVYVAYTRRVSVSKLIVETVLSQDPTAELPRRGWCNEDNFSIGSREFPANTLRFEGSRRKVIEAWAGKVHRVAYIFTERPETWVYQRTIATLTLNASYGLQVPTVRTVASHPVEPFSGRFQFHA